MHAVFYIIGIKRCVDELVQWLQTRTFWLPFENPDMHPAGFKDADGKLLKSGKLPIASQLRQGLFGTWELIFPECEKDAVLTTLRFHETVKEFKPAAQGGASWLSTAKIKVKIVALRKALGLEKIPEFKTENLIFMPQEIMDSIRFIPLGVRYDVMGHKFPNGVVHEAL